MTEAPEFSRLVSLAKLGAGEQAETLVATEAERAALARRFSLLGLDRLEARVWLRKGRGRVKLRLTGRLNAAVIQECVVTLEPAPGQIDHEFEILYGEAEDEREVELAPTDHDLEPLDGGDTLDIGEAVAQELGLNLDPYPRAPGARHAPGAALPDSGSSAAEAPEKPAGRPDNPFAVLKKSLPRRR